MLGTEEEVNVADRQSHLLPHSCAGGGCCSFPSLTAAVTPGAGQRSQLQRHTDDALFPVCETNQQLNVRRLCLSVEGGAHSGTDQG